MNDSLKIWWRTRTSREQRLLLAMLGLLGLVLLWLLLLRPLNDSLSQARERHGAAVLALAEARGRAAAITTLQQRPATSLGAPLETILNQSATEAGFTPARVQRDGANVAIMAFENVRPQAFFAWVRRMESDRGLSVERLSATTNTDQTLGVEIAFRARGS